jgi:F-type H+-transporting ATPase subunit gamma
MRKTNNMPTLEGIRKRIESAQDLQSIVKTMKGLAASSIWQYEAAVESLSDYFRGVEMGLHIVLRDRSIRVLIPEPPLEKRLGAIILGSDQGMVGGFNRQIASYAVDKMNALQVKHGDRSILAVGLRVTARLEERGQPIEEGFSMPGSIAGITPMVQELLLRIEDWRERHELDQILLFHHRSLSGASYRPHLVHLLPLDLEWLRSLRRSPWPSRVLPTFTMDWQELFAALIREYFFVALFRAIAESLASENASRLASMQAAEKNIEERLEELNAQFHHERQRSITEELLDIVAGSEALAGTTV